MVTIDPTNKNDLHWLAGWMEGEGCFYLRESSSGYTIPCLKSGSTDLDIVEKAHTMFGTPSKINTRIESGLKPFYYFHIAGKLSLLWMNELYPLMGRRRKEQIDAVRDGYTSLLLRDPNYEGRKRLGVETAREIRRLWRETDLTQKEIAKMFDTIQSNVSKIILNQRHRE